MKVDLGRASRNEKSVPTEEVIYGTQIETNTGLA